MKHPFPTNRTDSAETEGFGNFRNLKTRSEEIILLATDDILFPRCYHFQIEVKLIAPGIRHRFGAFLGEELVGDLCVYFEGATASFHSIAIHPDFRGRGIGQTLIYEVGKIALENHQCTQLTIEAEATARATEIYEALGFRPKGKSLEPR